MSRFIRLREPGIRGHEAAAGWLFLLPVIVILGLFLVLPILMAAWVSISDWNGNGSPLGANAHYVGLENYRHLLTEPGLDQNNFGTALRNNLYYVIFVVPIQTAIALFLAVLVNRRVKFVGFFRTAFYFPSVTSSVAITVLFLFLFDPSGAINKLLSFIGLNGPAWFYDPDGLFHIILKHVRRAQPAVRPREPLLPRRQLLGLARRAERRHVRLRRSWPSSPPRGRSCCSSSRPSRTSTTRSTRRPSSTARASGGSSATSRCR